MRTEPGFEGLNNYSIYLHAMNFSFGTVSHIAPGDISMISYKERALNAFIILVGT